MTLVYRHRWSIDVLRQLLFVMYADDLPICSAFIPTIYADGICPCFSHKNVYILQNVVKSEVVNAGSGMSLYELLSIIQSQPLLTLTRSTKCPCRPTELTFFHKQYIITEKNMCDLFGYIRR